MEYHFYNRAVQRKDYSDNTNSGGVYPVNAAVRDPVMRMKLRYITFYQYRYCGNAT
jgi:hypothetical protein